MPIDLGYLIDKKVRVYTADKKPPAGHVKKVQKWEDNNFEGTIKEASEYEGMINLNIHVKDVSGRNGVLLVRFTSSRLVRQTGNGKFTSLNGLTNFDVLL